MKKRKAIILVALFFAVTTLSLAIDNESIKQQNKHHLSKKLFKCNDCKYMHRAVLLNK